MVGRLGPWLGRSQENSQGSRVEVGFILELLMDGWRQEKSFGVGEGSQRHPSLLCVSDFWIGLGEITMVKGLGGLAFGSHGWF